MEGIEIPRADLETVTMQGLLARSSRVGAGFRARRSLFRRDFFVVVEDALASVTGIWSDGTTQSIPESRLGIAVLHPAQSVRSSAGRFRALLRDPPPGLTEICLTSLSRRWEDMLRVPGNVVGILLDLHPLGLSLTDALALPIDAWRVRYEFLRCSTTDAERRELAMQLVRDDSAPRGVRVRVAIAEGLDLALIDSDAALVFGAVGASAGTTGRIAADLIGANSTDAIRLRRSAASPETAATISNSARALAWIQDPPSATNEFVKVAGLPTSILDDLIDRGVRRFDLATVPPEAQVDEFTNLPLSAYIRGRLAPSDLSDAEVVDLEFAAEAYRRYIVGDDGVAGALQELRLSDAKVARSLLRGEIPTEAPTDKLLLELVTILRSDEVHSPSESLLKDLSVWTILISRELLGNPQASGVSAGFTDISVLHRARLALFEWDLNKAATLTKEQLRWARDEAVRDELLNIMACVLWLQDRPAPALAALDSALEGDYSDALLANAAVVASELDASEAVDRFVKLAREAPNPQQRAMAAERALLLWQNDEDRVWERDENRVPDEILNALRPLIGHPVSDDRYRRILSFLAANDDPWLVAQPATAFGTHFDSAMVRVYTARAKGMAEFVAALSKELKRTEHESWLDSERDALVSVATNVLIENGHEIGAALFGIALVEGNIPMSLAQRVPLICLTVAAIAQNVDTDDGEPKDVFIDWVASAKQDTARMDEDSRETFEPLVDLAGESLARSYARARARQLQEASDAFDTVNRQLAAMQSWQINHDAVRGVMMPISELCQGSWKVLNKVRPLVRDRALLEAVDAVMRVATDLGNRAVKVR